MCFIFFSKNRIKFSLFLLLLIFFNCVPIFSYDGWEIKSPPGLFSGLFTKMCSSESGKNIWAVGYSGVVACSNDSGVTWKQVPTGITNDLKGVFFLDHLTGWIVGGEDPWSTHCDGIILATTNGGNTWSIEKTSRDIYYDVQFLDSKNGWVVGLDSTYKAEDAGVVLHTTDGGNNWVRMPTEAGWIWCMDFLDSMTGFLGAEPRGVLGGDILKTTNGGGDWVSITISPIEDDNPSVIDLCMSDQFHGCCVFPYEGIKLTSDGGNTWNTTLSSSSINHVTYAGESTWFASSSNMILKSINNGTIWDTAFTNSSINDIVDLNFVSSTCGSVLTKRGLVFSTTNGGITWTENLIGASSYFSPNIVSPSIIVICINGGRIWISTNGGDTWQIKKLPTYSDITQVQFITKQIGWAATSEGLFKTTDGGESWLKQMAANINSFRVLNDQILIATSFYNTTFPHGGGYTTGTIWRSQDGGNSWLNILKQSYDLFVISEILNDKYGWAFDYHFDSNSYSMINTTNGGASWENLSTISFESMSSPCFVTDSIGWSLAVDKDTNWVVKTTDGGKTWLKTFNVQEKLNGLSFIDQNNGWLCGDGGKVYKTIDGGISFNIIDTKVAKSLLAVKFFDNFNGYIVGEGGIVLKTTDGGTSYITNKPSNITKLFSLEQNYPNPFNPTTTIRYQIPKTEFVTLKVYDILGREIAALINEEKPAGIYEVNFDAKNLASGIYFYSLKAGNYSVTKKLILLK